MLTRVCVVYKIKHLSNVCLPVSWTCPFLCRVLVVYPVYFPGCLRGITIQENKQPSKPTLDVYFIFKTRQKKNSFYPIVFYLSASVSVESNVIIL